MENTKLFIWICCVIVVSIIFYYINNPFDAPKDYYIYPVFNDTSSYDHMVVLNGGGIILYNENENIIPWKNIDTTGCEIFIGNFRKPNIYNN